MNYILFDDREVRQQLLPLTFTRPVCEIRIGILTIREKWENDLKAEVSIQTVDYLAEKFPLRFSGKEDNIWINGALMPTPALVKAIRKLGKNESLYSGGTLVAQNSGKEKKTTGKSRRIEWKKEELAKLMHLWDIFTKNGKELERDFQRLCKGKRSSKISSTNTLLGKNIFAEKGAKIECAILNSQSGPIYIGKDAEIMEGSVIRGPVALCNESVIKAGAKIYGPTTIGPHSKIGGEVNNSVVFGYSNKAHDGFLGNSVIGEWCNLGADTNNSNLKNNYSEVKMWNYPEQKDVPTGLTFCGLIMADHSKCGINTMFNTGTVVGVSANVFGSGFPAKFVPSFSWGGADGLTTYRISDSCETAARVFERRHKEFDRTERGILEKIFSLTKRERDKFNAS